MNWLWSLSLTDTTAQAVIALSWLGGVLVAAWGRYRLRIAGASIALTVMVWLVLEVWWRPFPDRVDWHIYVAGAGVIFSLLCLLWQRRPLVIISVVLTIFGTVGVFNLAFQEYPTVRSFDPQPVAVPMTYEEFQASHQAPELEGREAGALVTVDLPGTGFHPRPAVAYVPPAYWRGETLPVMVLMAGNPGSPEQWFDNGEASATADAYQTTHGGVSPIVVSVDATGSFTGNPVCVDGPEQKVMTYLTQDVPAEIRGHFRVMEDQSKWVIGGLSYGGTCALQVITTHPQAYGTFLDFSGQAEPTVGDHEETVERFFGGDEAAFAANNPADLLAQRQYPGIRGRFVAGEGDTESVEALDHLNDLARAAGMDTQMLTVPGGHSFEVWRVALEETFEWAVQ
ncbi:alpha/beta hydrolase [Corynebacterium lowii]|uniref:Endo-1,4-beta-xylanase Z n=1 Tax=Corynebacterium lowii TaxID=1544413 RepID=A0A0Q0Z9P4_9CORY|nr:alpha/beta hydrolase-fold protein [Corynebacterium lowii]KQB86377.1 Endo-1,4-beta-xylanase Z precursor [Corynebacterium lowii]MDP9850862.1 S-formylglutathione hydrolase FrmB [Corynebacterium lowii]